MFYQNKSLIASLLFLGYLSNVIGMYSGPIKFSECAEKIETIYGTEIITEPVLIDLINDQYIQRLKEVNQYGVDYYVYKPEKYTRYEHSLGVFFLVRKYGGSLTEQIAALLHDVSHTVFSHVGDFLFNRSNAKDSYQDDVHQKFIKKSSLKCILKKYGYKVKDILHKNKHFTRLEHDLPDICADRLEYNLFGGLLENLIDHNNISAILEDLKFEDNIWYFTDPKIARLLANISIYLTKNRFASVDTAVVNTFAAKVLKTALEINLLDMNDICYGHDSEIWSRLILSNNNLIKDNINKLLNFKNYYTISYDNFDLFLKLKCRVIDPLAKIDNNILRLSEIDQDFRLKLSEIRDLVSKGVYIKLI